MRAHSSIHRDGGGLAKFAAATAIIAIAWVFIAPSVDLLDSTCGMDDGASLVKLPAISATPFSHSPLLQAAFVQLEHTPVVSHSGSEVREVTCSLLC
jgi:hypothetical protein